MDPTRDLEPAGLPAADPDVAAWAERAVDGAAWRAGVAARLRFDHRPAAEARLSRRLRRLQTVARRGPPWRRGPALDASIVVAVLDRVDIGFAVVQTAAPDPAATTVRQVAVLADHADDGVELPILRECVDWSRARGFERVLAAGHEPRLARSLHRAGFVRRADLGGAFERQL